MLRHLPPPAVLPSRAGLLHDAAAALDGSTRVFVTGDRGSGLTVFGTTLLTQRRDGERIVHRITGSPALMGIPFAAVAALGAQVPGLQDISRSPVEMMSRIAQLAPSSIGTLFLDRAEHIDEASAAAIAQLVENGAFELIVGYSDPSRLPADLLRLTFEHGGTVITLPPLTLEDTLVLLEDLLGAPFDVSSAQRLHGLAAGNPLLLRELAIDAQTQRAFEQHRGYLSISASWKPQSGRVSQLVQHRLATQPAILREAVEITAVLGELPREIASRILSPEQIDEAVSERLLSAVPEGESGPDRLVLGAGLAPATVVSMLGTAGLAATIERVRAAVPAELLTPNIRVQLATHSRNVGIEMPLDQLVADASAAAQSRQFDAVIALTEGLSGHSASVGTAPLSAAKYPAAEGELRMFRSEAFLETGDPHTALEVLEPMLAARVLDARLFASFVEFSGLGRPDLMQRRLADEPAGTRTAASTPPEVTALRSILTARAGEHVPLETLRMHAADTRLTHRLRLSISAQLVAELSYLGFPADGLAEFERLRDGELWARSPISQRGELMHTLLVAIQCDGAAEESYLPLFAGIDWDHLALDHATFLAAKSIQLIERGQAAVASQLLAQAFGLLTQRDPHLLTGFVAALDSAAAVMLGDTARARAGLEQFRAGSVTSGQVARLEARRLVLSVVQAVEGDDAARGALAEMLAEADRRGHRHVRLRLLHEAWRLRLAGEPGSTEEAHAADALSAAAEGIQGPYAEVLRHYSAAFGTASLETAALDSPQRMRDALDAIIAGHIATGSALYAAEAAARGAEEAKARGERRRASELLDACAAVASPLSGVHTPSLRRVRIDSALLSDREYEVCLRAAAGLSNAEIADEQFVSPRTVEGHLQRAYGKLGVTDRRMLLPPM